MSLKLIVGSASRTHITLTGATNTEQTPVVNNEAIAFKSYLSTSPAAPAALRRYPDALGDKIN